MGRRRSTKGWEKEGKYKYSNRNTDVTARVRENPNYKHNGGYSDKKWLAQVVQHTMSGRYAMKSRTFKKKGDARDYILDYIDSHTEPQVTCDKCGAEVNRFGSKSASGNKIKIWWDCQECGYEGPSRHTVQ